MDEAWQKAKEELVRGEYEVLVRAAFQKFKASLSEGGADMSDVSIIEQVEQYLPKLLVDEVAEQLQKSDVRIRTRLILDILREMKEAARG